MPRSRLEARSGTHPAALPSGAAQSALGVREATRGRQMLRIAGSRTEDHGR